MSECAEYEWSGMALGTVKKTVGELGKLTPGKRSPFTTTSFVDQSSLDIFERSLLKGKYEGPETLTRWEGG